MKLKLVPLIIFLSTGVSLQSEASPIVINVGWAYPSTITEESIRAFYDLVVIELEKARNTYGNGEIEEGAPFYIQFDVSVLAYCRKRDLSLIIDFYRVYDQHYKKKLPYTIVDNTSGYNPSIFSVLYSENRVELLKKFIRIYPQIIFIGDSTIDVSIEPIAHTVGANDIVFTELLLQNGANPNTTAVESFQGNDSGDLIRPNLLGLTRSEAMIKLLVKYGADTFIPFFGEAYAVRCLGNNVRVRAEPNTKSAILGLLKKGEEIEVEGMCPIYYSIEGHQDRWVKVKFGATAGWVFGQFLELPYR